MNNILIHLRFPNELNFCKTTCDSKAGLFSRSRVLEKIIKKFPIFHGTQCFVPGSQKPASRSYPKPHESSPNAHTTFLSGLCPVLQRVSLSSGVQVLHSYSSIAQLLAEYYSLPTPSCQLFPWTYSYVLSFRCINRIIIFGSPSYITHCTLPHQHNTFFYVPNFSFKPIMCHFVQHWHSSQSSYKSILAVRNLLITFNGIFLPYSCSMFLRLFLFQPHTFIFSFCSFFYPIKMSVTYWMLSMLA